MAEVVLTFDNTDRKLPLDFDEVSVARRFYRGGEGDYRIQGNRCRLMDITDLIVDRGLGSSGYWILEARMVETILSSRPEDRRFLFDEAAGIVKYKIQRHRAELKLDAASADLDRLNDIVCEVERTVDSLRKQVRTFRKFEKAATKVKELEGLIVKRELEAAEEKSDLLMERDGDLAGREDGLAAAVSAAAARLAEARLDLEKAQQRLDGAHASCADLDAGIASIDRDHAVTLERIAAASLSIEENAGRMEWQRRRASELGEIAAERDREIEAVTAEIEQVRGALQEAEDSTARCREEHAAALETLGNRREERNGIEAALEAARRSYGEIAGRRERALQELESGAARRAGLLATRSSLEGGLESGRERLRAIREEIGLSASKAGETEKGLEEAGELVERLRGSLREAELRAGSVRTVIVGLGEALRDEAGSSGRLSGMLRVRDGMEKAAGAYLDAFQDALFVTDPSRLAGDGGERFALGMESPGRPGIPDGAVALPDLLTGEGDGAMAGILAGGILAPDRRTALGWLLEGVPFDIVTPDGSLFRRDGLVRLGVPSTPEGSMDRKALLEEAERELAVLESEISGLSAETARAVSERDGIAEALSGLREERLSLEREEASLKAATESLEGQLQSCDQAIAAIDESVPGLEEAAEGDAGAGLGREIDALRERLEACSEALRGDESRTGELTDALGAAQRSESEKRFRLESLEDRLTRTGEERGRLLSEAEGAVRTAEELAARTAGLEEKREELRSREKELEAARSEIVGRRSVAEEERTGASRARAEALESAGSLESSLQEQREALTLLREERARTGSELATLDSRILELRRREIVLPAEGDGYWNLDADALSAELSRQIGYRENVGPVNMLAVTEFEEAKRRLDYLSGQREDLQEARESLRKAIDEINRTAARRFAETFIEVREHFRELFVTLFGGGEADIVSLESDDPLEGGVQIMARPRGKKLENVTALSGGERALTAVALLFALYLVKPSPFCILDELDAPLDDSNIDRFIALLRKFSDRTQFVMITHNKRTMEAADRLFGITMEEDGVSVMTSVSLEDIPEPDRG
jgi:chromosome segregation protein